jgi:hypothetical protein
MFHLRRILVAGLALSCLWAAGCASSLVAPVTPPPPQAETIPNAPSDDHVWIPGHWIPQVGGYLWKAGYWALPPHPGAKWVPDKWSPGQTTPDVRGHWE